jgi:hypothetical protein
MNKMLFNPLIWCSLFGALGLENGKKELSLNRDLRFFLGDYLREELDVDLQRRLARRN